MIHIAGTKGKGSTAAFCEALLRAVRPEGSSARTGLYTSPHMVAARERIRIDGVPLSEEDFARFFWEVWDRLGENTHRKYAETALRPMYFRFMTLLALHTFLSLRVSATVLEVGIGGLYDSTNIVQRPVVTGVSALGIDHTAILGNTLEEIAFQKAGIFKAGVPALSVPQPTPAALDVLRKRAADVHAASFDVVPEDGRLAPVALGLPGRHQRSNASLALALVRCFAASPAGTRGFPGAAAALRVGEPDGPTLTEAAVRGLEDAFWPGRCQVVPSRPATGAEYYLDGAHTRESLQFCVQWFVEQVAKRGGRRVLIFNCTNGRSAATLLQALLEHLEHDVPRLAAQGSAAGPYAAGRSFFDEVLFCTNNTFANGSSASDLLSKAVDAKDLAAMTVQRELLAAWRELLALPPAADDAGSLHAEDPHGARASVVPSIEDAMAQARAAGASAEEPAAVLVCGSLHLVGGVMAHLQQHGALDERLASMT